MPPTGTFQAAMRRAGVSDGSAVVVYDEADATAAARAWWLLRYFGHRDGQVLDGGFRAWVAAGGQVATGECTPPGGGDFTARPGHMPVLDARGGGQPGAPRRAAGRPRAGALPRRTGAHRPGRRAHPWRAQRAHHGEHRPGRPVPARGGPAGAVRDPGRGGRCRAGGHLLRFGGHRGPRGSRAGTGGHSGLALRRLLVELGRGSGPTGRHRPGTWLRAMPRGIRAFS